MPDLVVFDTNVWISGLLWRGKTHQCLLMARAKLMQAVYCPPMVAELTEKLRQKFGFPQNDIHAVVYSIRQTATCVEIAGSLHVVHADPEDDKFVECAVVSGAQTIVSGDRHLLTLGSYNDIQILAAADCVRRYGSHE